MLHRSEKASHKPGTDRADAVANIHGPGKHSLVERDLAVGHSGPTDSAAVHRQATTGTAGPGGPPPFAHNIQQLFGRHNIAGVRAHTDQVAADPHGDEPGPREATHGATASAASVSSRDSKLIHRIKVCRNEIGKLSHYLHKYLATPCDDTLDAIAFALDSLDGAGEVIEAAKKVGQALDVLTGTSPDCHALVKDQVEDIIHKLGDQLTKMEEKLGYCPA